MIIIGASTIVFIKNFISTIITRVSILINVISIINVLRLKDLFRLILLLVLT